MIRVEISAGGHFSGNCFDTFTCCAMEVVREDDCGGRAMLRSNWVKSFAIDT